MLEHAIKLLNLQAQDRIVRYERLGAGMAPQEIVYYVECVDYERGIVHARLGNGNSRAISFADISDIQKTETPITVRVPERIWRDHDCNPAYLGQAVRPVAVTLFNGAITGVEVPRWPGEQPGRVLTLAFRRGEATLCEPMSDTDLIRSLPSSGFNPKRYGDMAATRNRILRVAGNRVAKFLHRSVTSANQIVPPLDPSFT